jgi:hypothetical protein
MVTGIEIDELKERVDRGDSFVLVNAAENISVCSMDAIKGTYCIPKEQLLGQLAALFPAKELSRHGYTNVEYVMGTLVEWKDKGYPTESLWPAYDWHD